MYLVGDIVQYTQTNKKVVTAEVIRICESDISPAWYNIKLHNLREFWVLDEDLKPTKNPNWLDFD